MLLMDQIAEHVRIARIARHFPRAPAQRNRLQESDAELLDLGAGSPHLLALKIDAVTEEVRAGLYDDPFLLGWMTATSCLSDLAAVGAEPLGLVLALTLPQDAEASLGEEVARGVAAACAQAATWVLGGDLGEGPLSACGAAAGLVPRAEVLTRLGARPGDLLYLSGPAGLGNAFALARLAGQPALGYRPRARLAEGRLLRRLARCCIDTSDGLLAAVDTLSRLNNCGAVLELDRAGALHPEARALAARAEVPAWLLAAGPHGEFELCFAVAPEREAGLLREAATAGWQPVPIGAMAPGEGLLLRAAGAERRIDAARLRNLGDGAGRDPQAYLRALRALAAQEMPCSASLL